MQKDTLEKLTAEKSNPCLTISLNTLAHIPVIHRMLFR